MEEHLTEEKMIKSKEALAVMENKIVEAVAVEAASLADMLLDDKCEVPDNIEPDALCMDKETCTHACTLKLCKMHKKVAIEEETNVAKTDA
eukprot:7723516-Ditylum_brightwellii.AAC.1